MKANKIKQKKIAITYSPLKLALFSQFVTAMAAALVFTGSTYADQMQLPPSVKMATPIEIPGDDKLKRTPPLVGATPIEIPDDSNLKRTPPLVGATPIEIPGDPKVKRTPPLVGATPIEIPGDGKFKMMTRPPSVSHSHGGRSHSHPLPAEGVAHRHGNGPVGQ